MNSIGFVSALVSAIFGTRSRMEAGQLTIGGVPIPASVMPLSFMLAGSPGTGKSSAINGKLDPIRKRGDRVIMADAGGEAMARWWQDGDTLLNPLDARGVAWSPFAEMEGEWDADRLARSIIPDGEGSAEEWAKYSQALVSAVLRRLWESGNATNERFAYYLTIAKAEEIEELVKGLPAQTLFDTGAAKMLSSVRGIIGTNLGAFSYLDPEAGAHSFSIRKWIKDGSGWLWMPYRDDMLATLAPLIRTWCDMGVSSVLSERPSGERAIWLIVDELAALGRITALPVAMTQGRKYGLRVVAGLQSIAQLVTGYGPKGAETLLACFQNWLVLRVADAQTAEAMSKQLGDHEILRTEKSESRNDQGASKTEAQRHATQRVVMASEIQHLPDRTGYLSFAGAYPIARVGIPVVNKAEVLPPFVARPRVAKPSPQPVPATAEAMAAPVRLEL